MPTYNEPTTDQLAEWHIMGIKSVYITWDITGRTVGITDRLGPIDNPDVNDHGIIIYENGTKAAYNIPRLSTPRTNMLIYRLIPLMEAAERHINSGVIDERGQRSLVRALTDISEIVVNLQDEALIGITDDSFAQCLITTDD